MRFKVGDSVIFEPGVKHAYLAPESLYEVVALLPREDSVTENTYRIKSKGEAMVRVVRESQLRPLNENEGGEKEKSPSS